MSKFIRFGYNANETVINTNDIVNIQRESNSFVSICYRSVNDLGEPIIEKIHFGMSEESYKALIKDLEAKKY